MTTMSSAKVNAQSRFLRMRTDMFFRLFYHHSRLRDRFVVPEPRRPIHSVRVRPVRTVVVRSVEVRRMAAAVPPGSVVADRAIRRGRVMVGVVGGELVSAMARETVARRAGISGNGEREVGRGTSDAERGVFRVRRRSVVPRHRHVELLARSGDRVELVEPEPVFRRTRGSEAVEVGIPSQIEILSAVVAFLEKPSSLRRRSSCRRAR